MTRAGLSKEPHGGLVVVYEEAGSILTDLFSMYNCYGR